MGPEKSTTPSWASSVIRDRGRPRLDFDLPDVESFRPLPTNVSLERMQQGIQQARAWFPDGIPTAEERWSAKTDVEFRL